MDTPPPGLADHPDYEIRRELGRGGMGVVYLAHNRLMGRDEVLKVMSREIVERPGVLDRFLREIRAVARLRHPHIVAAHSAARIGDDIVFAMEYVEGLDLAKLVRARGPLPVAHACLFIHQAASGLQHAHEQGLVHRDIKPGNLMLSRQGDRAAVKVLDFGLAKATREQTIDGALTSAGQALGTPDYIAPEQILDAQAADIRADIYSLGGTLYYLLTGRPPFRANSLYELYQSHLSKEADPLPLVRPEVPPELAAVVARMMAKDPAHRFQTPGEVARALTPFFKKATPAPATSRATESPPDQTGAVEPASPPPAGRTRAETSPEGRWRSAIGATVEPETTIEPPPGPSPVPAPARRPRRAWPAVVIAAGVLALSLIASWAGGVFHRKPTEALVDRPAPAPAPAPPVAPASVAPKVAREPKDPLPVGSIWTNAGDQVAVRWHLIIRRREGDRFQARHGTDDGETVRDVSGTIHGNAMEWRASDVAVIKGYPTEGVTATIDGDTFEWHSGLWSGTYRREVGHGDEAFRPGSSWSVVGPGSFTITVLAREGDRFTARAQSGDGTMVREITGTVRDGGLFWYADDIKILEGPPVMHDNFGVFRGAGYYFYVVRPEETLRFSGQLVQPPADAQE